MTREFSRLFFILALALSLGACTSSKSDSDAKDSGSDLDAVESESGEVMSEGDAGTPGDPLAEVDADMADGSSDMKSDEAIDAPLPDATTEGGDPIVESPAVASSGAASSESLTPSEPMQAEAAPSTESGSQDLFGGGGSGGEAAEAPQPKATLRKIETVPFKRAGILSNAVYIARDGDDLDKVSQKTGSSKKDLRKVNSFLSRGVKVGDKIYYNSRARAEDSEKLQTYYEDLNLPPQVYTAQPNENIRDIAQNLLGNRESWKELWATNLDVESKGALPEGTQLRYWPLNADGGAEQTVASNDLPPPPAEPAMPDVPPPPPIAAGSVEPPPPPPVEPPPPVSTEPAKPAKLAKKSEGGFVIPGLDQDTTFAVVGAGILIAGFGAITAVRRSRARKLSANTQTQI